MPSLPKYNAEAILQPALNSYTNTVVLAANVPEFFNVPQDETGKYAGYVTFGKGASADFFAKGFTTAQAADRTTGGNFTEHVTNGGFGSDTGWTKGTGWTISAGTANATTASSALSQNSAVTLLPGMIYTITYTITRSAGTVTPSIGGTAGTARSSSATFSETIICGSTQVLAFTGVGFTGTVDNVSVIPWVLGSGWASGSNVATATTASTALSQTAYYTIPLVAGQAYLCTYTTTRSAGSVALSLGGGTAGASVASSTTTTEVLIAGSTQAIAFTGTGFTGTIDDVTILPCASVPADATSGLSPDMNPLGYFLNGEVHKISVVSASTPTITASFYK